MSILDELTILSFRFGAACTEIWLPAAEYDRMHIALEREWGVLFSADLPMPNFLFRGRAHVRVNHPAITEPTPR